MMDELCARLEGNKNLSIGPAFSDHMGSKEEWAVVEEQDGLETLAHIPDYYYSEEQERLARDIARAITDLPVVSSALLAVLELHRPTSSVHGETVCGFRYCYDGGPHGDQHVWPCPTVKAIQEVME